MIIPGLAVRSWSVDEGFLVRPQEMREALGDDSNWVAVGPSSRDPECPQEIESSVAYCSPDIARLVSAIPEFVGIMEMAINAGDSDFDPSLLIYKARKAMKKSGLNP